MLRRTKVWLGGASVSTYGDRFMVGARVGGRAR